MNYYNWIIPIILIIIVNGLYIGTKLKRLIPIKTKQQKIIYWSILFLILITIILSRNVLIGILIYFVGFNMIFDFFRGIFYLFKSKKARKIIDAIDCKGIPFLILSILITIYGAYNIDHPIIKPYTIKINQNLKNNLTIGMISDLHLGNVHNEAILNQIVEHANSFQPDIFILAGDIFDEYTSEELKEKCYETLQHIKTKYGIYYIEGNHDLLTPSVKNGFTNHNIQVLDDKSVLIDNSFYLVGRKDLRNNKLGNNRADLSELLKDLNQDYPIVLLDHQPVDEENAQRLGVDLQLSGHTHAGQIFPANFLLKYGYRKSKDYQIVVSSGYSGWGFALRTAGRSEMLKIKLTN